MKRLGVEIEFTGVKRIEVVNALEFLFKTSAVEKTSKTTHDNYIYHKIVDTDGNDWTIKRDRSIKPQVYKYKVNSDCEDKFNIIDLSENDTEYMVELVSPVLTSKTLPTLFTIIDVINSIGGIVNKSCGIHVHIDALPVEDVVILMKRFILEQDEILDKFQVADNRRVRYCKPYDTSIEIPNFTSLFNFMTWLWENYRDMEVDAEVGLMFSKSLRYYALNFYSLMSHDTIEYRLFNATLDKAEVVNILKWVLNFTYPHEQTDTMRLVLENILLKELG